MAQNSTSTYLTSYAEIQNKTVLETLEYIKAMPGLALSEITIDKLVWGDANRTVTCEKGVYFFREEKKLIYVGDCMANNFVVRIPAHFDIAPYAWMNRLLKIMCEKREGLDVNKRRTDQQENLEEQLKYALEHYNLILVKFEASENHLIHFMEGVFKTSSSELLNKKKTKEYSKTIKDICVNTDNEFKKNWAIRDNSRKDFFIKLKAYLDQKLGGKAESIQFVKSIHNPIEKIEEETKPCKHTKNIGIHIKHSGIPNLFFEVQDHRKILIGFFDYKQPNGFPNKKIDGLKRYGDWKVDNNSFLKMDDGFYSPKSDENFSTTEKLDSIVEELGNTVINLFNKSLGL